MCNELHVANHAHTWRLGENEMYLHEAQVAHRWRQPTAAVSQFDASNKVSRHVPLSLSWQCEAGVERFLSSGTWPFTLEQ